MTQYIWEKEIDKISWTKVKFKDWSESEYTKKSIKYIVTDEPKDLTTFQMLVIKEIEKDILNVLEEHDVRIWDVAKIYEQVILSLRSTLDYSTNIAFWIDKNNSYYANTQDNIRISDIKRIKWI